MAANPKLPFNGQKDLIPVVGVAATPHILIVNNTSVTETFRFFRCVVSITNQLSSVTTNVAEMVVRRDLFVQVSSLNDVFAREYDNVSFSITASSISSAAVSYQWQKSTDYNRVSQSGNWINISGETTNTLNLFSVNSASQAYYRVRITSFGGEVVNSNAAFLSVTLLSISVTRNIPSSITVLEGVDSSYIFDCLGVSSLGNLVNYQWEIKRAGDSSFVNIGNGFNEFPSNQNTYNPRRFDKIIDNQCKIRCRLTADEIPGNFYTNECTVNVRRRFTYFAPSSAVTISAGQSFVIDLNHSTSGGSASFMWQKSTNGGASWTDTGETTDQIVISSVSAVDNNTSYRCRITLDSCDEYFYTKNGSTFTISPTGFSEVVTLFVSTAAGKPTFYSLETQKTGAAIGTVICVAKPADFQPLVSTNADDISRWKVSVSGSLNNTSPSTSSVATSGSIYSANKPSWADSSYTSPKWLLSDDRFKGYLEMRGQFLKAKDFPELARMFGTTFGGTISGVYPNYAEGDTFRMPILYGKRLMGTGNVDNNRGSVSINPIFGRNGLSGGDKNVPGSIGGRYNWGILSQLPPGSPGVGGGDGQAGIDPNPATFSLGSFTTTGVNEVNSFVQPVFNGTVFFSIASAGDVSVTTPIHNHRAVVAAWERREASGSCRNLPPLIQEDTFVETRPSSGELLPSPGINNASHGHTGTGGVGSFSMTLEGGMSISDSTIRLSGQSQQLFNNSLRFFLRNAEDIPVNSPYFRLKYMIKAY